MAIVFILNEINALRFVLSACCGRRPYLLAVEPLLPPLRPLLERLAQSFIRRGLAAWVIELCPEMRWLWEYPTRTLLYDVFGSTEAWHNEHFGFSELDGIPSGYATACKKITCNHMKPRHFHALILDALWRRSGREPVKVVGLTPETAGVMHAYFGHSFRSSGPAQWWAIANFVVSVAVTFWALGWIAVRIRMRVEGEPVFFAADYLDDEREFPLYHRAASGGALVLVPRDPSFRPSAHNQLRSYRVTRSTDGRFTPADAWKTARMVLRDGLRLFSQARAQTPAIFFQVASLPYRRAVLRAFFVRYRVRFFWGRDDYNVEHILRREEIHRIGGTSLGIIHGYPTYAVVFPMWRYISFDRYYVFGRAVYDHAMKDTWAADMQVVPVGSFGAPLDAYARRHEARPADIVVYVAVFVGDRRMAEFVRELAQSFPERKVFLQVKNIFVDTPAGREFVDECRRDLANVVPTRAPLFDLVFSARYGFSDPSTVVVEGLQFGQCAFFADLMTEQRTSIYRDYPDLCVHSANAAVARIRDIEAGRWRYPREKFSDLVDLSGRPLVETLAADLGLIVDHAPSADRPAADVNCGAYQ